MFLVKHTKPFFGSNFYLNFISDKRDFPCRSTLNCRSSTLLGVLQEEIHKTTQQYNVIIVSGVSRIKGEEKSWQMSMSIHPFVIPGVNVLLHGNWPRNVRPIAVRFWPFCKLAQDRYQWCHMEFVIAVPFGYHWDDLVGSLVQFQFLCSWHRRYENKHEVILCCLHFAG